MNFRNKNSSDKSPPSLQSEYLAITRYLRRLVPVQISLTNQRVFQTPIEDQAIGSFLKNFVLMPCEGNSRSYMSFVVPTIEAEESLIAPKSPLSTAGIYVHPKPFIFYSE